MGQKEKVERFVGRNFHTWQTRLRFLLQKKELWKLVTTAPDQIPVTREAKSLWDLQDTKALAIIALALGDEYLHHISNAESTKSAWDTLDKLFGASGKNAKINLKLQLFRLNMKSGSSFPIHLNEFKSLLGQLASVNKPVDNEDCIALLLKSMPEEYDNIVTTLLNMPSLNLNDVQYSLMDEYNKKQARDTSEDFYQPFEAAHFVKGKKFNNNKGFNKEQKKGCTFCGKDNHIEENCFHRKKAQKAYFSETNEETEPPDAGASHEANFASIDEDWVF